MPWRAAMELLVAGGLAGAAGGVVRYGNPQRRRLGMCVLWELPSAMLIGMAGYAAAAGLFGLNDYGRFCVAFAAGYLGHAAVHDFVVSAIRARVAMDPKSAAELQERRDADREAKP